MTRAEQFETWLRRERKEARKKAAIKKAKAEILSKPGKENEMRRPHTEEPVAMVPGSPDHVVIAKRQTTIGGKVYPCGSVIPFAELGANYEKLFQNRYVAWAPPPSFAPPARDLPAPEPTKALPAPQIVGAVSAAESLALTIEANERVCAGTMPIMDYLHSSAECRDLIRRAQVEACALAGRALKRPSLPVNQAWAWFMDQRKEKAA